MSCESPGSRASGRPDRFVVDDEDADDIEAGGVVPVFPIVSKTGAWVLQVSIARNRARYERASAVGGGARPLSSCRLDMSALAAAFIQHYPLLVLLPAKSIMHAEGVRQEWRPYVVLAAALHLGRALCVVR